MEKGYLLLESGDVFEGFLFGNEQEVAGEVVFNTSMTGYQEIITDPSYAGQILVFCYPLIGNYGINSLDNESMKPQLKAIVIGEICETPSHFLSERSLADHFADCGVTGLAGVDTRSLVQVIRKYGTIRGLISKELPQQQKSSMWQTEPMQHLLDTCWVEQVSTTESKTYENQGSPIAHVALIDYGYKKSILDSLLQAGCKVTVVPYTFTFEQIKALNPDGVLFSNGPGDPMTLEGLFPEIKKISEVYPSLGICLGHQLIALAHGAQTEKLQYGHRGGNHPVKEVETGKVRITSQNHGYVVIDESIEQSVFHITYYNVNDGSVEGLKHKYFPIQTVQFHPEAHSGPNDTAYIFESFIEQVKKIGEINYAVM